MPTDPLDIPPGSLTLEAITDLLEGSGGTPGGDDTQLQYDNAGEFGGIAESAYIPDEVFQLATVSDNFQIIFATGPSGNNFLAVTPSGIDFEADEPAGTVSFQANESVTLKAVNADVTATANGNVSYTAVVGNISFVATAGQVNFNSGSSPPKYKFIGLPVFANNAAAIAGGLQAGNFYRTGADPDPVFVVH